MKRLSDKNFMTFAKRIDYGLQLYAIGNQIKQLGLYVFDIKPQNMMIQVDEKGDDQIYLIDNDNMSSKPLNGCITTCVYSPCNAY